MARNEANTLTVGLPAFQVMPVKYGDLLRTIQISISARISQVIDIFAFCHGKEAEHS